MNFRIKLAAFAALATATASPALAVSVVDQAQYQFNLGLPFAFDFGTFIYDNMPVGQSFTAGMSGRLDAVSIYCNGACDLNDLPNTLTMQLYSGGDLSGSFLGLVTQTPVGTPDPAAGFLNQLRMDFSGLGIQLVAGNQYSFAVTNITGPGELATRGTLRDTRNPYAGGRQLPTPGYGDEPDMDLMFTTEMQAAVPEPASWALMIGGFGMVGATLRRRRSVTA